MLDIYTFPSGHTKALGLHWDTGQDAFYISIPDLSTSSITTNQESYCLYSGKVL